MNENKTFKIKIAKLYDCQESIVHQCQELADYCNQYDKINNPYFFEDCPAQNSSPHLYYAQYGNVITGFISVYSYDNQHVEICGFVLPQYRNQKVFTELFYSFSQDYHGYSSTIPIAQNNKKGLKILSEFHFLYQSTECQMLLTKKRFNHLKKDDSGFYFTCDNEASSALFNFFYNEKHIGTCSIFSSDDFICIHDMEIFECYRGKGYGYRSLNALLYQLFFDNDKIILHVTKENIVAFELYQKLGFNIKDELKYYYRII